MAVSHRPKTRTRRACLVGVINIQGRSSVLCTTTNPATRRQRRYRRCRACLEGIVTGTSTRQLAARCPIRRDEPCSLCVPGVSGPYDCGLVSTWSGPTRIYAIDCTDCRRRPRMPCRHRPVDGHGPDRRRPGGGLSGIATTGHMIASVTLASKADTARQPAGSASLIAGW